MFRREIWVPGDMTLALHCSPKSWLAVILGPPDRSFVLLVRSPTVSAARAVPLLAPSHRHGRARVGVYALLRSSPRLLLRIWTALVLPGTCAAVLRNPATASQILWNSMLVNVE
jgi:hypothetical protein